MRSERCGVGTLSLLDRCRMRLKDGAAQLSHEHRAKLYRRLIELRAPEGGFQGLDGRGDLYFSAFGFELAEVFLLSPRPVDIAYIETSSAVGADGIAAISLLRCRRALGCQPVATPAIAERLAAGIPAPYEQFLTLFAADLIGSDALSGLASQRARSDLVASTVRPMLATTLAAAIAVAVRTGNVEVVDELAARLLELRHSAGGWRVAAALPDADLLATAAAVFALDYAGHRPPERRQRDRQFVLAHRCADGGFAQRPGGGISDVESTWYALLALGAATNRIGDSDA
ncbi:MAG: hypothetical protein N2652_11660 [Kiritimatiellae bacterium]|nr:hypothetical protein [Kiritimatiellia bacterium]